MILFCFLLVNKLASRGQGWLEHHLEQLSTRICNNLDNTPFSNTPNMADVLCLVTYRRLRHPGTGHLSTGHLSTGHLSTGRPGKSSANQPNAMLHPHATKPR